MNRRSVVVGIAGGTGSGKSTIAREIVCALGGDNAVIVPQDAYYLDLGSLPTSERGLVNFDHPDAFDWPLLRSQVRSLRAGRSVDQPVYDFRTHSRRPETQQVDPRAVVIPEGILIFHDPDLRDAMDVKVFVDIEADIRLLRRLERDIRERGRSLESVVEQYLATVRPMHTALVEPAKCHADIIVPGGGRNRVALDLIIAFLRSEM